MFLSEQQKLHFAGKVLQDNRTLASYGISSFATLSLSVRFTQSGRNRLSGYELSHFSGGSAVSERYGLMYQCVCQSLGWNASSASDITAEICALLDSAVRDVLLTIVPDAMRFARWAAANCIRSAASNTEHGNASTAFDFLAHSHADEKSAPESHSASASASMFDVFDFGTRDRDTHTHDTHESIVITGPHIASSLHLHPLLGGEGECDLSLLNFGESCVDVDDVRSCNPACSRALMFPLARDLLTVAASRLDAHSTDINAVKPVVVAPESGHMHAHTEHHSRSFFGGPFRSRQHAQSHAHSRSHARTALAATLKLLPVEFVVNEVEK